MDLLQSVVYVFAFSYSQHFFQDQVAGRGLGSSPSYASTSDEAFGWSQSDFLLEFITSVVERVIIIKHRGLSARRCPMPSSPSSSNSFCLLLLGSAPGVVPCPNWQHRPAIPCGGSFSLVCAPWSFSAPGVVPCPNRQPFPGGSFSLVCAPWSFCGCAWPKTNPSFLPISFRYFPWICSSLYLSILFSVSSCSMSSRKPLFIVQ